MKATVQSCQFVFFLTQVLKFWIFLMHLRLDSDKALSELHIHCNHTSVMKRVHDHAGCKEYCNDFTFALKMLDVLTGKEMLLKIRIVLYRYF